MDTAERLAWAVLASVPYLGPATIVDLVAAFGSARAVVEVARAEASGDTLRAAVNEGARGVLGSAFAAGEDPAAIDEREPWVRLAGRLGTGTLSADVAQVARDEERIGATLARLELAVVTLDDETYPARLRSVEGPPPVLFVAGDPRALGGPAAVGIVGTRRPSEAGRRWAGFIAGAVSRAGAVVVSGLALGIDGAAHAAAVAESAPTVAVLGGGHARLFPAGHRRLVREILAEGGAVAAEVGPLVSPEAWRFPLRNRIISALSDAVVVVEAPRKSGALVTAHYALEQGRAVFVVPGSIETPTAAGCLALLRASPGLVRVVAGVEELVEDLELDAPQAQAAGMFSPDLGPVGSAVAAALTAGATTVDEVVARTHEAVPTVLSALTLLEMRGLAVAAWGRYRPAGQLASGRIRARRRRAS